MLKEFLIGQKQRKIQKETKMWEKEKKVLEKEQKLEEEKKKYHRKKFKISTTKLIIGFILLNCTCVEIYSMWIMYKLSDLSALYTLITAVVGETISFAIYAVKATKENTVGGVTYETALRDKEYIPPNENVLG